MKQASIAALMLAASAAAFFATAAAADPLELSCPGKVIEGSARPVAATAAPIDAAMFGAVRGPTYPRLDKLMIEWAVAIESSQIDLRRIVDVGFRLDDGRVLSAQHHSDHLPFLRLDNFTIAQAAGACLRIVAPTYPVSLTPPGYELLASRGAGNDKFVLWRSLTRAATLVTVVRHTPSGLELERLAELPLEIRAVQVMPLLHGGGGGSATLVGFRPDDARAYYLRVFY